MNDGAVYITLDGPPVAFARMRVGAKTGVMFEPSPQRHYKSYLRLAAQQAMSGRSPITEACQVVIDAFFPIPASWSKRKQDGARHGSIHPAKRPDASNIAKLAEDALNGIVYDDDSRICQLLVRKTYSDKPRIEIRIETI